MIETIRTLREWSPMVSFARQLSATDDPHEKALVVGDMAEWLASRTRGTLDDRLAARVIAVLKTPEGEALVRDVVAVFDAVPPEPAQ